MKALKDYNTCELVAELELREGVASVCVNPYQPYEIKIDNPDKDNEPKGCEFTKKFLSKETGPVKIIAVID